VPVEAQTAARLKRIDNARGNGTTSNNASLSVVRQNCGAPSSGNKRPTTLVALEYLQRFYEKYAHCNQWLSKPRSYLWRHKHAPGKKPLRSLILIKYKRRGQQLDPGPLKSSLAAFFKLGVATHHWVTATVLSVTSIYFTFVTGFAPLVLSCRSLRVFHKQNVAIHFRMLAEVLLQGKFHSLLNQGGVGGGLV
jgi:hypothetical protein